MIDGDRPLRILHEEELVMIGVDDLLHAPERENVFDAFEYLSPSVVFKVYHADAVQDFREIRDLAPPTSGFD